MDSELAPEISDGDAEPAAPDVPQDLTLAVSGYCAQVKGDDQWVPLKVWLTHFPPKADHSEFELDIYAGTVRSISRRAAQVQALCHTQQLLGQSTTDTRRQMQALLDDISALTPRYVGTSSHSIHYHTLTTITQDLIALTAAI